MSTELETVQRMMSSRGVDLETRQFVAHVFYNPEFRRRVVEARKKDGVNDAIIAVCRSMMKEHQKEMNRRLLTLTPQQLYQYMGGTEDL